MKLSKNLPTWTLTGVLVLVAVAFMTACNSLKKLEQPKAEWVRASRATYEVIGPKLLSYVEKDDSLTVLQKDLYKSAVGDWEFMIRAGEDAISETPGRIVDIPVVETPR